MPIFTSFANIVTGSTGAAIAVFGLLGVTLLKMMVPLDGVKERFGNMMEGVAADIAEVDARLKATSDSLATVESAQKGVQSAAKGAGGTKSKLVDKAAKGKLTDPKQMGQLSKTLDNAQIKDGVVTTGVLKGLNEQQVKNLKEALDEQIKKTKEHNDKKVGIFKRGGLRIKQGFLATKNVALKSARAIGKGFQVAGRMMNSAMKFAGFIGMLIMIIETVKEMKNRFGDMVRGIIKGAEFIINGYAKFGNMIIGVVEKGLTALRDFRDFIVDKLLGAWNLLLKGINVGREVLGMEAIPLVEIGKDADDAAVKLKRFNDEFKFDLEEGALSGIVAFADGIQAAGEAAENTTTT